MPDATTAPIERARLTPPNMVAWLQGQRERVAQIDASLGLAELETSEVDIATALGLYMRANPDRPILAAQRLVAVVEALGRQPIDTRGYASPAWLIPVALGKTDLLIRQIKALCEPIGRLVEDQYIEAAWWSLSWALNLCRQLIDLIDETARAMKPRP